MFRYKVQISLFSHLDRFHLREKERMWCSEHSNYSNYQSGKWCPLGAFGQGCFYTTDKDWEEKKSLWKYYNIFLKMFFLISGLILMSYITTFCKTTSSKTLFSYWWRLDGEICFLSGTWQCKLHSEHYYITLINVVHINKIYIWLYIVVILGKTQVFWAVQICANIKLNKVVYIKLQNKSVYQYFFT